MGNNPENKFNRINRIIIVSLCILILFAVGLNAATQSTQRPARTSQIEVTLINQEPDPAEPGNYVDVRFKLDNNGSEEARNVEVEILPQYPFSLDPGVEALRSAGTLQSMQRGDVGVIVKYRIRVDKNAVEGENEIKIRYRIDKGIWIEPEEFFIDVQTYDAILSVDSVSIDKEFFEPGSSGILRIGVVNEADSLVKDVKARLDLGGMPFVPLKSTNEKSVYQIDAKKAHEFSFELLAKPEAESGVYQVPLRISYSDELNKGYIKNATIGVIVNAKPDISVTLDESGVYEHGKAGEIVVKVVNKGVTDIKFMNVKLGESSSYKIVSSDEAYLGNIDSDDFETADFDLFVENTNEKQVELPLTLEYKDANNNNYRDRISLKLNLYSASEAKKFGLKKENGTLGFLIVVAIVIGGLFYYRKRMKKKG
ncbi:hypothetical protein HYW19_02755 [Candidatus Woesearchaeota archaeon]|nr:hypothetical protein [Candidatus Woesearchaeota archaeon]